MIRIFLVARSRVTQAGLSALLAIDPDFEIVGSAIRPDSISDEVESLALDVVLIEQDALFDDLEIEPAIVLLIDEIVQSEITQYLHAGIRAILLSDATNSELINAIKAAAVGLTVFGAEISILIPSPLPRETQSVPLTAREIEVLEMLAEGLGNKAIAQRLNLSEHTVKFHISSIFSKLDVSSRTEAVILGAKQGWIFI